MLNFNSLPKPFILVLFLTFLMASCGVEEIQTSQNPDENLMVKKGKPKKIMICHYSSDDDQWLLLEVNSNAWGDHVLHGDVRLDDQDGDGFVPNNACDYGAMGDCDDSDSSVNPASSSLIAGIRTGGQTGDSYIGPSCSLDGSYRTCFYVTGTNLPADMGEYTLTLNGTDYPIAFFVALSDTEVVICVDDLYNCGEETVNVSVQSNSCAFEVTNLYEVPDCGGEITEVRLGGEPGDSYIGLACNEDSTYRTCFYISGTDLLQDVEAYHVKLNGEEYPIAFFQAISPTQVVVCITDVESCDGENVNVSIESGCTTYEAIDLYTTPECSPDLTSVRTGGLSGDSYVGPTCNEDGTYRTCYYVTGTNLPQDMNSYSVSVNGAEYPIAFFQTINSSTVVVCVTDLDSCEEGLVDVSIASGCNTLDAPDLYTTPNCGGEMTNIRVGGEIGDSYVGPTCNGDGTYRTCFYVTGQNLPQQGSSYLLSINGTEYPIAFFDVISLNQVVMCATDLPYEGVGVDVSIQTIACNSFEVTNLYDSPDCTTARSYNSNKSDFTTSQVSSIYAALQPEVKRSNNQFSTDELGNTVSPDYSELDSRDKNRNLFTKDLHLEMGSLRAKPRHEQTNQKWLVNKNK